MNAATVQYVIVFAALLWPYAMCYPQNHARKLEAVMAVKHGARSAIAPAFSADCKTIATASQESSSVKLWSVPDGALKGVVVRPGNGGITSLQLSKSLKFIATASLNRSVNVIRIADGVGIASIDTKPFLPCKVAFSSDDQIVYCMEDYRFDSRLRSCHFGGLEDKILASGRPSSATICIAKGDPFLVSADINDVSIVELIDPNRGISFGAKNPVRTAGRYSRFSVTKDYVACAVAGEDRIALYRLVDGKEAGIVSLPANRQVIDFKLTGKMAHIVVASSTESGDTCFIATYDGLSGVIAGETEVREPILEISVSQNSELVAVGMYNGDIRVFSISVQ